jgi:superfamily I DNA and/or RNA helicase
MLRFSKNFIVLLQAKLVIVGHRGSLMSYQPFRELIEYLEKKERVILLNSDDLF